MSQRNTVIRSLHDLGVAAWFGGSLMGVVGLNGATAQAQPPAQRLRLASIGWARWAPVQLAAIVAHGVGGLGLILANKSRLAADPGSRTNTIVKTVVTVIALGATLWSGLAGLAMAKHSDEPTDGVTEPSGSSDDELQKAQQQQKILQWIVPAATGVLIVLGAQQGEQQRPFAGIVRNLIRR